MIATVLNEISTRAGSEDGLCSAETGPIVKKRPFLSGTQIGAAAREARRKKVKSKDGLFRVKHKNCLRIERYDSRDK